MEKTTPETATPKTATKADAFVPRNFLATFLLAINLGFAGANRLYTGDSTLGWIRFGLFAGGIVLSPLGVGVLLVLAAYIWGVVDVFLVYHGNRLDADGKPMTLNSRDQRVANTFYILFLVGLVMSVLMLIIMILLAVLYGGNPEWRSTTPQNTDPYLPGFYQ